MRTTIVADADAVAAELAREIAGAVAAGAPGGIMVSGARALARTYQLAERAAPALAGVDAWYADERAVAATHPDSSHGLVRGWLERAGATIHRIPGELGAIQAARVAAGELRARAGAAPEPHLGVPALAAEGAVAALHPGDPALSAATLYFPARGGTAVTATVPLLARARRIAIAAIGPAVAEAFARLVAAPPSPDLPASLVVAGAG